MPQASRQLSPAEIANGWARRMIQARTQTAIDNFKSSPRETALNTWIQINSLVISLPDAPMPPSVRLITQRLNCAPEYLLPVWVDKLLTHHRYALAEDIFDHLPKATDKFAFLDLLHTKWKYKEDLDFSERNLLKCAALGVLPGLVEKLRSDEPPYPSVSSAGLAVFLEAVRKGEVINEAVEAIHPKIWLRLCSVILDNENLTDHKFHLGRVGLEWLEATRRRVLLSEVSQKAQAPSPVKASSSPRM